MSKIVGNKLLWEKLHQDPRFCPRYPHERVIQFIFGNFPRSQASDYKILDHGAGAGRHLIFLAENNYQAYGTDVSEPGLAFAKKMAKIKKLKVNVNLIDSDKLKYPDNFFDGVVSSGVLYYLGNHQLDKIVPDLYRILKKGGKMLLVVRSRKDYRFKHAKSIGHGDYLIVGDSKTRVDNEDEMLMHFFDKKEIKERFRKFSKISIDEMMNTYNNSKIIDHDYIIELQK